MRPPARSTIAARPSRSSDRRRRRSSRRSRSTPRRACSRAAAPRPLGRGLALTRGDDRRAGRERERGGPRLATAAHDGQHRVRGARRPRARRKRDGRSARAAERRRGRVPGASFARRWAHDDRSAATPAIRPDRQSARPGVRVPTSPVEPRLLHVAVHALGHQVADRPSLRRPGRGCRWTRSRAPGCSSRVIAGMAFGDWPRTPRCRSPGRVAAMKCASSNSSSGSFHWKISSDRRRRR